MKKLFILFVLLSLFGCDKSPQQAKMELAEQKAKTEIYLISMIESVEYIRDSRTNLCFAYTWVGDIKGGPALATVPCEAAGKLLINK